MNQLLNPTQLIAIGVGPQEMMWIAVIVLVLFGGAKIPQLMRGIGQGVGELQKGLDEVKKTANEVVNPTSDDRPKS